MPGSDIAFIVSQELLFSLKESTFVSSSWEGDVQVYSVSLSPDVTTFVLPRNSSGRSLPSHALDYRRNIAALKKMGVTQVLATSIVGSLRPDYSVGDLVILDQFLDFTKRRQFTFFDDSAFGFVDMTEPYCPRLRKHLQMAAAESLGQQVKPDGTYVCTDGPRFETAAEVQMFAALGGHVIGMTSATESIMAREAGVCYAALAGIVNMGAGLTSDAIDAYEWRPARKSFASLSWDIFQEVALGATREDCSCRKLSRMETPVL